MGVNRLKIIINLSPNCSTIITKRNMFDRTYIVDISGWIYLVTISLRNNLGKDLINNDGLCVTHIYGMWRRIVSNIKHGINTFMVFDGAPPKTKNQTLKDRRKVKNDMLKKLEEKTYKNEKERINLFKKSFSLNESIVEDIKTLFNYTGIRYIEAKSEGESQCSAFSKAGYGDVISQDYDSLLFCCKNMIINYGSKNNMRKINLDILLEDLGLNHDQFIDLCNVLGNDYQPNFININPETALEEFKNCIDMDLITFIEICRVNCDYQSNNNIIKICNNVSRITNKICVKKRINSKNKNIFLNFFKNILIEFYKTLNILSIDKNNIGNIINFTDYIVKYNHTIDYFRAHINIYKLLNIYFKTSELEKFVIKLMYINQKQINNNKEILYNIPDNFIELAKKAKSNYKNQVVYNPRDEYFNDIKWNKPDEQKLKTFLVDQCNLNKDEITKDINDLVQIYEKYVDNNKSFKKKNYYYKKNTNKKIYVPIHTVNGYRDLKNNPNFNNRYVKV